MTETSGVDKLSYHRMDALISLVHEKKFDERQLQVKILNYQYRIANHKKNSGTSHSSISAIIQITSSRHSVN